jgi:hypothetical protein
MFTNHKTSSVLAAVCLALGGLAVDINAQSAGKKTSKADAADAKAGTQILDNFIKVDWSTAKDSSSEAKLSQVAGPGGSALRISYDLKNGKWIAVSKGFSIDDFKGKAISFQMKSKGANNNLEVKLVDEDGTNYGVKRPVLTESEDWTTINLSEADFSYWWGGDPALGSIKAIYFAVSAGDGGAGEVMLANLQMGKASKEGHIGKGGMIFDGQSKEGWMVAKGEGSSLALEVGPGEKGSKAMALKYTIPAGQWVSIRRNLSADLSALTNQRLVIRMKGEGDPCDVEIKLIDRDDSTFGKVLSGAAGSGEWADVSIPLSEFAYMWGGDSELDASLVRYLDIAISGVGGTGKVMIGSVRLSK